jgi:hypothetical protein
MRQLNTLCKQFTTGLIEGGVHAELFPGTWKLQSLDYCQFVNNADIFEQISLQTKIPVSS